MQSASGDSLLPLLQEPKVLSKSRQQHKNNSKTLNQFCNNADMGINNCMLLLFLHP
jgi:hypothetical protein